ncbi:hypothetical protein [Paenibacillus segetis]|uniref:DUF6199 domain-containing protein n=1 Tax=Paenibacillus segetis TaxID=1325360 RepID=A0ABQ1YER1_9BACL|nr:hypothetical protein [Paenibacillus segetis]GGH23512.1 hypothetical protein GCM10008013_22680 [Paenibacillus segetis]
MSGVANIIFGLFIMAFGLFAIRKPDSWWFRRLGDDSDQSEERVSYLKIVGIPITIFGLLVIAAGIVQC